MDKLIQFEANYYSQNGGKNGLFKKSQKLECAKAVSSQFSLAELVGMSIYIVPGSNRVYLNYPIVKHYACPDNYQKIVSYILQLYQVCIDTYGKYELHVNLQSFTISAAERYKDFIKMHSQMRTSDSVDYTEKLDKMVIYYTPSMMDTITQFLRPFIDKRVAGKVKMYSKDESAVAISENIGISIQT